MCKKNKDIQEIINLLEKPVFIGFSEYTLKIRRNLVGLSIFIIFYKLAKLKFNYLFGLDCSKVPLEIIDSFLISYLFYSAIYFYWEGYETFLRWKIRLTGTFRDPVKLEPNQKHITKFGDDSKYKLQDIGVCYGLQSYLYSTACQIIKEHDSTLNNKKELDINKKELDIKYRIDALEAILNVVQDGLLKFDKSFKIFKKHQVFKFFFLNIILPAILSVWAFYLLLKSLLIS